MRLARAFLISLLLAPRSISSVSRITTFLLGLQAFARAFSRILRTSRYYTSVQDIGIYCKLLYYLSYSSLLHNTSSKFVSALHQSGHTATQAISFLLHSSPCDWSRKITVLLQAKLTPGTGNCRRAIAVLPRYYPRPSGFKTSKAITSSHGVLQHGFLVFDQHAIGFSSGCCFARPW